MNNIVEGLTDKNCVAYKMLETEGYVKEDVLKDLHFFYFAGLDTSSHFLSSCLYYIHKFPDVKKNLLDELDRNGFRKGMEVNSTYNANTISNCEYLNCVIKESFRMDPTAFTSGSYKVFKDTEI